MLRLHAPRPAIIALLAVATLVASVAAQSSGSGSSTSCLISQYLDSVTGECVDYKNQGEKAGADYDQAIDSGNTAWMMMASALVMIMTPGVAFFYAGLAGEEMASNTIMMSFVSMAMVTIQFWAFGYSAAFGSHGLFGWAGYNHVGETPSGTYGTGIPHIVYAFFQTQFAAITPAELSGGIVGRMKFGTYLIFIFLWTSIVYEPLVYWIWSQKLDDTWNITPRGWEGSMGALDFGGGTVIHVSGGFGALAAALMVGKRYNHGEPVKPHNVPLVMIGCTFLWFGWFGFNGGSGGAADGIGATAAINTHLAASAGFMTWVILEYSISRNLDPCGAASGAVAGMATITPGSGYVLPWASLIFGVVGAITGFFAVKLKNKLRYDDTLDVFAIHGCGGFMGGLLTGLFATSEVNPSIKGGAFYGHGMQFVYQLVANAVAAGYVFFATLAILVVLKYTVGLRINEEKEVNGIDVSYHGGLAYDYSHHGDYSEHGPKTVQFKAPETSFEAAFMKSDPAEQA
ncbi:Ammonium Transporter (Amt) Family [Phytophthora cinnamomi]|uniref:Ammonium Transporter (Amt) Family n=1 Tax=Phytophthora cinnamomi TaxID=4785 RepID=UPI003559C5F5|nr:Ammonium Transporter (Amt) Family [Phytophthora cinnamomi]